MKRAKALFVVAAVVMWVAWGTSAWAQIEDPATLFIGDGVGGFCPKGSISAGSFPHSGVPGACWVYDQTAPVGGDHLNELVFPGSLDIFKHSNGGSLNDPVQLIFGVPNVDVLSTVFACATVGCPGAPIPQSAVLNAGTVTGASLWHYTGGGYPIAAGDPTFKGAPVGVSVPVGGPFMGTMTGTPGQDVYNFLGLGAQAADSNSFVNWLAADRNVPNQLLGLPVIPLALSPTGYGIYVYFLSAGAFGGIDRFDAIDVSFLSCFVPSACGNSLPVGSFAVAYGLQPQHNGSLIAYSTPFTQAGFQMPPPVSEPSSWLLLGTVLLGLVSMSRRKKDTPAV